MASTQRASDALRDLNGQNVQAAGTGGLSENGKVNGPSFGTPPVFTNVIKVYDAMQASDFQALEPSIQEVNGSFNQFAVITGNGDTKYGKETGPDWGPSLAKDLGINSLSFRTYHAVSYTHLTLPTNREV